MNIRTWIIRKIINQNLQFGKKFYILMINQNTRNAGEKYEYYR